MFEFNGYYDGTMMSQRYFNLKIWKTYDRLCLNPPISYTPVTYLCQSSGNRAKIHRIPDYQPNFLTFCIGNLTQKLCGFASGSVLP